MPRRRRLAPEECYPAGVPGISVRFVTTRSGARVRVVEAGGGAGARAGSGDVLLVHGWGCNAYLFRHLTPALADAGHRVFVPDLLGHGQSDKPGDPGAYTLDAMAGHVAEVMDALGLSEAAVVGHSLGGAIALRLTTRAPDRVRRLALFAPVGLGRVSAYRLGRAISPRPLTPLVPVLAARRVFEVVMRLAYGPDHRFSERDVDEYWAPTRSRDFAIALRHLVHAFDWGRLRVEQLSALRAPTLVVFGSRDRVVSPSESGRYVSAMPDGRLVVVPRVGHVVPEELPELAVALLREFLRAGGDRVARDVATA